MNIKQKNKLLSKMYKINQNDFKSNRELARKVGAESIVVLKNNAYNLPLSTNKVALFGIGSVDTAYTPLGNEYVYNNNNISIYDGLKNNGVTLINNKYLIKLRKYFDYNFNKNKNLYTYIYKGIYNQIDDLVINEEDIDIIDEKAHVLYVIRRLPIDNEKITNKKGSYLLTDNEIKNISFLNDHFNNITILINSYIIDLNSLNNFNNIKSILYMGYLGCETGNALYDALYGINAPDGRITATIPVNCDDLKENDIFDSNESINKELEVTNDIFNGYRYFESFSISPLYPFSFGLSYTTFNSNFKIVKCDDESIVIKSDIKNTGKFKGRETIQFYITCLNGLITKPSIEMKAFLKTKLLEPGEECSLNTTISINDLKVYDENNHSYIIEKGKYILKAGRDAINNSIIAAINFDDNAIIEKTRNILECDKNLDVISPENRIEDIIEYSTPVFNIKSKNIKYKEISFETTNKNVAIANKNTYTSLIKCDNDDNSLKNFISSIGVMNLIELLLDNKNDGFIYKHNHIKGPFSISESTNKYEKLYNIPDVRFCSGTNGIHIPLISVTSFPSIQQLGQTFDTNLIYEIGSAISNEMKYYKFSSILSIHTDLILSPLSFSPYNYFSEDPLLTGIMASSYIKGIESNKGISSSINLSLISNIYQVIDSPISVNERAIRDYYFKANEIIFKSFIPKTLYISNEYINGKYLTSNKDFINDLIKSEWKFDGLVIENSSSNSIKGQDIQAGVDYIIGTSPINQLINATKDVYPEFNGDGTISTYDKKIYKSLNYKKYSKWNSFKLNKYGEDGYKIILKDENLLNSSIQEMINLEYVSIEKNDDKSLTIYYRGDKLGVYLTKEDINRALNHVLKFIMNSYSFQLIKNKDF